MKLFDRMRKSLMRWIFSIPSPSPSSKGPSHSARNASSSGSAPRRKSCDHHMPDPPKTSCSSFYSFNSHHSEAIDDCIEFLNKSQQGMFSGQKSHYTTPA